MLHRCRLELHNIYCSQIVTTNKTNYIATNQTNKKMFSKRFVFQFVLAMTVIVSLVVGDRPRYVQCHEFNLSQCNKRPGACQWTGVCEGRPCARFATAKKCLEFGCEWASGCRRRDCTTYDRDEDTCKYFGCSWSGSSCS